MGCWALLSLRAGSAAALSSPPPAEAPRFGSESVTRDQQPPLPSVRTPDPASAWAPVPFSGAGTACSSDTLQ